MKKGDAFESKWLSSKNIDEIGDDNGEVTLTINSVRMEEVGDGQKPVAYFSNKEKRLHGGKGLVLNVTRWNTIEGMYGEDSDSWIGKQVTLFVENVAFKGNNVPSIKVKEVRQRKTGTKVNAAPVNQDADDNPEGLDDGEDD